VRSYIVDDDVGVRQALRLLLEEKLGVQVVGEAAHAHGLTALVETARADLVLVDWELPGSIDAALLARLHQLDCRPRIIVLSSYSDVKEAALAAGADAFAAKCDSPDLLASVIIGWPAG